MSKEELIRKIKTILEAHKIVMLEQNGRPDCKNCVLSEALEKLLEKV